MPALRRFGEFIKNDLYPAVVNFLGDAAFFIVGTVIPRLKEFYNFLSGTLVPFLVDKVVGAFETVKGVVDGLDFGKVARLGGIVPQSSAGSLSVDRSAASSPPVVWRSPWCSATRSVKRSSATYQISPVASPMR